MHDRAHAAQRMAKGQRVGEVPERDLHPHPLGAQTARIAHQAPHRLALGRQPAQQRGADQAGGAGEQDHRRRSLGVVGTGPPTPTA